MNFLRWLLVIPGGFLAGVAVLFPLHWFIEWKFRPGNDDAMLTMEAAGRADLERVIGPGLSIFIIIYVGALIAPKARLKTAWFLAVLCVLLIVTVLILSEAPPRSPWMWLVWPGAIIGGILAVKAWLAENAELMQSDEPTESSQ